MLVGSDNGQNYKWINYIKSILISVGKPDLINQPVVINSLKIVQTLKDLYVQDLYSKLTQSSKSRNYALFKDNPGVEPFLTILTRNAYIPMLKFRTSNSKLPVETGIWRNVPLHDRKCELCNKNDLGDEFHCDSPLVE